MIFNDAIGIIAQLTAPLRRFSASSVAGVVILAVGLSAMTVYTVPVLQSAAGGWLAACLWCCLAYFAVESAIRARTAIRAGLARSHFLSFSFFVDVISVTAVPIALLDGITGPNAWLFASFWVLKLAQNSPGFAQLGRVFALEAKPLASVFALFLIVLFLSSATMYVIERQVQPRAFSSLPEALWWAVVTLT
ncbi:MAG: ion transporter, partial [Xanthobacteraceae bacterium]